MTEAATKLQVKSEKKAAPRPSAVEAWRPFESLRAEIDRLFDDARHGLRRSPFDLEPFWKREPAWDTAPAVDIAETEKAYEVTAELPGMEEKNVEVKLSNGNLTIKGEKKEQKEERKKDYYLSERRYGSFERSFRVPEGVDVNRIEAQLRKGVLTVTLPKTAEAQKAAKEIPVRAA